MGKLTWCSVSMLSSIGTGRGSDEKEEMNITGLACIQSHFKDTQKNAELTHKGFQYYNRHGLHLMKTLTATTCMLWEVLYFILKSHNQCWKVLPVR